MGLTLAREGLLKNGAREELSLPVLEMILEHKF
jgi:hypothetical protein